MLLLLLWSLCLGWGLAVASEPRPVNLVAQKTTIPDAETPPIKTVDVVTKQYQLGQQLYLENCATCHLALPPAVMPTQTWQQLLQDTQHYGVTLNQLSGPYLQVVWEYVRTYSRPLMAEEEVPYRVYQSHIFKALHPKVKLPSRLGLSSCVSCHPGADKYDFRSLSAEWQNAP
jgi:hypothetical protein